MENKLRDGIYKIKNEFLFQLPQLLQTVTDLQKQSEMPCFNPENVVFITNKWDLVQKQIESSDEDDSENKREEEIGIWENLKKVIKQMWPLVREENIFKMNLKDVIIYIIFIEIVFDYPLGLYLIYIFVLKN